MRLKRIVVFAAFLCAISLSAQTVDEIIAKNLQAHGGVAKLKAIHSIRITGNFDSGGVQAGFVQVYKRPMRIRMDATLQGVTLTQAYDGQNGWQIMPFTGQNTPAAMNAEDLKRLQEEADFDGPLMDYKQKGNAVELVGKEKVDGADTYHLRVSMKNGDVLNFYLDATTYLTLKRAGKAVVQGTPLEVETHYSDYREVDGVKFPFSLQQEAADGQVPDQKITFQKVELNVPVEDSVFKMPAAAQTPKTAAPTEPKKPD